MIVFATLVSAMFFAVASDVPGPDHGRTDRNPAPRGEPGIEAPLVSVDRFSDAAGTQFRRSADPSLPGPNVPLSLDDPRFRLEVEGPDGRKAYCYRLDSRPAKPNRLYVFYDSANNYRLGQYPVIDSIPGDPGYSDLWDIWKVYTPDVFYETNWLRDAKVLEEFLADKKNGFTAESTGIYLNAPIVPEGTTASLKAEGRTGGATQRYFAWYRGKRAAYLYFEGSLRLDENGMIPIGEVVLQNGKARAKAWPKGAGYSPLVRVVDGAGKVLIPMMNCPIVGTGNLAQP
ncbi:MAG TPA: hypothetical protein VFV19_19865 [Candidatus Polarisedimenticolaceae bacterium]|nr:hypothetical protein [Candidatus Polarisedimenticolaceae bacterium]